MLNKLHLEFRRNPKLKSNVTKKWRNHENVSFVFCIFGLFVWIYEIIANILPRLHLLSPKKRGKQQHITMPNEKKNRLRKKAFCNRQYKILEADYWEWDNKSWTCTIGIDELIVFLMMQNDIISIECSTQIILCIKQLPNAPESGCLWIDFSFIQKYFLLQTKIDEEEPLLNKNMLIALEVLGCQSKKKNFIVVLFCFVSLSFA